jgi:membrane associated rhomboid family serine protease
MLMFYATTGAGLTIAIAAHIGGFIAGLLLARPLLLFRYRKA